MRSGKQRTSEAGGDCDNRNLRKTDSDAPTAKQSNKRRRQQWENEYCGVWSPHPPDRLAWAHSNSTGSKRRHGQCEGSSPTEVASIPPAAEDLCGCRASREACLCSTRADDIENARRCLLLLQSQDSIESASGVNGRRLGGASREVGAISMPSTRKARTETDDGHSDRRGDEQGHQTRIRPRVQPLPPNGQRALPPIHLQQRSEKAEPPEPAAAAEPATVSSRPEPNTHVRRDQRSHDAEPHQERRHEERSAVASSRIARSASSSSSSSTTSSSSSSSSSYSLEPMDFYDADANTSSHSDLSRSDGVADDCTIDNGLHGASIVGVWSGGGGGDGGSESFPTNGGNVDSGDIQPFERHSQQDVRSFVSPLDAQPFRVASLEHVLSHRQQLQAPFPPPPPSTTTKKRDVPSIRMVNIWM